MRALAAMAAAGLLLVGAPAAAGPTAPLLAVTPSGLGLVLLTESGDLGQVVVPEGLRLVTVDAVWSVDGTRIAFSSPRDGVGRDLYVVNADGTGLHAVTSGSDSDHYDTVPVWISRDEIAYHHRDNPANRTELRVVDVSTGVVRRLVAEADANFPPRLQPGGSLLVYATRAAEHRALVDTRTGAQQPLPDDVRDAVAWAPDGTRLAYGTQSGLFVLRPDGSDRRTLVADRNVRSLEWSPDGSRLVFTIADLLAYTKVGWAAAINVYSVDADGSNLHRLTGLDGDSPFTNDPAAYDAHWWPGGSSLFFTTARPFGSGQSIWTMNSDGSCEQPWRSGLRAAPSWRPGAVAGPSRVTCTSAIMRVRPAATRVARRERARITVQVANDGTQPLTNLSLEISSDRGVIDRSEGCGGPACTLASLAPGARWNMSLPVWARTAGAIRVHVRVRYDGVRDVFPADDEATALVDVRACDLLGSYAADRLLGTSRGERICGDAGDDRIEGRGGDDVIEAGPGNDTVIGGAGRDRITGGGGRDVILVRDGARDVVDCGTERDTVVADRRDVVARTCETVLRA